MQLYIIGFSGSGKSTLARQLASDLHIEALDTDDLIETEAGCSIAELVQTKGWDAFRELESKILLSMGTHMSPYSFSLDGEANGENRDDTIIACGGGIVELAANRDYLKSKQVLWLNPPWQLISDRLQRCPSAICTGRSMQELNLLYHQRYPLYKEVMFSCRN